MNINLNMGGTNCRDFNQSGINTRQIVAIGCTTLASVGTHIVKTYMDVKNLQIHANKLETDKLLANKIDTNKLSVNVNKIMQKMEIK